MLLVSLAEGRRLHDLAIDCPAEAEIGLVVDSIVSQLRRSGTGPRQGASRTTPTLRVASRSGRPIPRSERLIAADIHDGDVISIVEEVGGSRPPRAVATLTVLSGPDRGRVLRVAPGESRIGRDRGFADLVLADPTISRVHALLRVSDTIEVADAGSTNGIEIDGRVIEGSLRIEPGQSFTIGDTELVVGRVDEASAHASLSVPFNPTPRIYAPFSEVVLEYPAPPTKPAQPPIPWMSALIPVVVGAGLALATNSLLFLAFMLMSPLLIFASTFENRRQQAREHAAAMEDHEVVVAETVAQQATLQEEEVRRRHGGSPAITELAGWAPRRDLRLWERGASHVDVLSLRIGSAQLPSLVTAVVASGGRHRDRKRLLAQLERTRTLPGLPVTADLLHAGHVGIAGAESAMSLARSLVAQAAALHSPANLTIAAIVAPSSVQVWDWLKWLPHTRSASSPLAGDRIATHPDTAVALVERLTQLARERASSAERADDSGVVAQRHRLLVVVDGAAPIDPARLAELYDLGPAAGIHVVFVGSSHNVLPRACGVVIVAGATADTSTVGHAATGEVIHHVTLEGLSVHDAQSVARSLAPIVDISAPVEDEADIPDRVGLVEVLGGPQVMTDTTLVAERWAESVSLVAVFGQMAGAALRLDMRVDGPHALVAGTTGAGKSELLQSYISALALTHSPKRVNFLLVDYKGGAAFKECRDLPHSVGLVTDLNTQEVRRVLISLNAEIRRREHLLEAAGAKDLIAHEELNRPDTPANLLIIVDEFAALAKEVPEFVAGVVDLAQRGRSLGMHLLLATQRPAGVITDNIRANTNLRIALRVADDDESTDVIGVPTAAHISRNTPGRGVYRAGPKEIRAFQAGYVGGRTSLTKRAISVEVGTFSTEGVRPLPMPEVKAPPVAEEAKDVGDAQADDPTDLQRIVTITSATAEQLNLPPAHRPWLDPLPALLPLQDLVDASEPVDDGCVLIGTIDDPDRQLQRPAVLDLARTGSVLVVGTLRSGKTALLRTIAAAITLQGGESMDVYAMDFAGRGLSMLAELPHVGAVIAGDDGEGIVRLFATLRDTITRRAHRFAAAGVSDLTDYHRRSEDRSERRIVVLLDGVQSFDAAFERIDRGELTEVLPQLIAEGRAAGVHFVMTADRRAGIRSAIFGLISTVVVLRQSSTDELSNLNLRGDSLALDAPPGRCWIGAFEGHLALLGDPEGDGQATALAALARARAGAERAPGVARIPLEVNLADLAEPGQAPSRGSVVVGLDGVLLAPVHINVLHEHLLVCGPRRSGRTKTLATLAAATAAQPWSPPLYLCTPRTSELLDAAPWTKVAETADASLELLEALRDELAGGKPGAAIVVVDDLSDMNDILDDVLVELLGDRRTPVHVIAADEARKVRSSYGGSPIGELRQAKRAILLQPSLPDDSDMFDVRLTASSVLRFPAGRGFLVETDTATLLQVARP